MALNVQKMPFSYSHEFSKKNSLPWEGVHPPPPPTRSLRSLALTLWLTNPSCTTGTGIGVRGPMSPPPPSLIGVTKLKGGTSSRGLVYATSHITYPLIITFNVHKMPWHDIKKKSPYRGSTPSHTLPHSVASLPRFGPPVEKSIPGYGSGHDKNVRM